MIELILHHKELTRRDLMTWALRSLVVAPVLGLPLGAAWGAFVFGPVGGSLAAGVGIGAMMSAALSTLSAQALGMGTVRARTLPFAACILLGTAYAILSISLGAWFQKKPDWLIPALMIAWLCALATAGWFLGRTRPS